MPDLARQLLRLLNTRERRLVGLLVLAMLLQAVFELLGVGSILPFMSVVADPGVIQRNELLRWFYEAGDFQTDTGFLTALGFGAIAVLALGNTVSAATQWATLRFVWGTHHRLAVRLLKGYLAQPYSFFLQRNSAGLHKNILSEVQSAINSVLRPAMTLVARSLVTVALVGLLVAVDPLLALMVVAVLGGAYGTVYFLIRNQQARLGRERVLANEQRYKAAGEAFGGIKDVKVLQREAAFVERFGPASWAFSRSMASNQTIAVVPRYLLETIAFSGILLIVVYYLQEGSGLGRILPTVSLYAFAGYRLMPALQQLFAAAASIRFNRPALEDLIQDLQTFAPTQTSPGGEAPLPLSRSIQVENVTFRYPGATRPALEGVSLTIPRNASVGLVGASGSGKTTLVDLLLGFHSPEAGRISVDGTVLNEDTLPLWLPQVGYVPQHIFLCDDTIANNIAFGVLPPSVDPARVQEVAEISHLSRFVQTLPDGYETVVGERGVRLSGGQRQRIGIARALYHDPEVMVMDEATSALDGGTEDQVMEAIRDLAGQKTIILIAHRLTTVRDCDRIFLLEEGRVVGEGTFHELADRSESFRKMARLEHTHR